LVGEKEFLRLGPVKTDKPTNPQLQDNRKAINLNPKLDKRNNTSAQTQAGDARAHSKLNLH